MAAGLRSVIGRLRVLALVAVGAGASLAYADVPPSPAACAGATEAAEGAAPVDARALRLGDGRVLRLAGIEPFALLEPGAEGAEAKLAARLAGLLAAGPLRVQIADAKPDRYGRLPALVFAGDRLVQEIVLREGLALAYAEGPSLPCFAKMLAAEDSARRAGSGFWRGMTLPYASPDGLAARVGRFTIFTGRILSVGNRPARSYLNFGRRWSEDVTVEIAASDRQAFGGEAGLAALAGRRVRVRGFLAEKSGPMMAIASPAQIEVLEPQGTGKVGNPP